jgi:hypothetical protein
LIAAVALSEDSRGQQREHSGTAEVHHVDSSWQEVGISLELVRV